MIAGAWPEKTTKPGPTASPSASGNPLYRYLPYLCDWKPTIAKIENGIKSPSGQRLPGVIVRIATLEDCYEQLITRLATRHLASALALGPLQPEIKIFDWLETFDDEIHTALEAPARLAVGQKATRRAHRAQSHGAGRPLDGRQGAVA